MIDVELSVHISRDSLGLGPLEIASSPDYYLSTQFLGASVQWTRQQVESAYLDGAVTVNRHRQMVTEQVAIEVTADNLAQVQQKINTLIRAFVQDSYTMNINSGGSIRSYRCEAADYQDMSWTTPRMAGAQGQVVFSVPRQPVEATGSF